MLVADIFLLLAIAVLLIFGTFNKALSKIVRVAYAIGCCILLSFLVINERSWYERPKSFYIKNNQAIVEDSAGRLHLAKVFNDSSKLPCLFILERKLMASSSIDTTVQVCPKILPRKRELWGSIKKFCSNCNGDK